MPVCRTGSKPMSRGHGNAPSNFSTSSGFWFLNERSREIFSCNFIRLRHLFVNSFYRQRHFIRDRASNDHHIALPWRETHYFCAEARDVEPRRSRRHQLDCATSEPHRHRPKRIFSYPIEGRIKPRKNHIALDFRIVSRGVCFGHK